MSQIYAEIKWAEYAWWRWSLWNKRFHLLHTAPALAVDLMGSTEKMDRKISSGIQPVLSSLTSMAVQLCGSAKNEGTIYMCTSVKLPAAGSRTSLGRRPALGRIWGGGSAPPQISTIDGVESRVRICITLNFTSSRRSDKKKMNECKIKEMLLLITHSFRIYHNYAGCSDLVLGFLTILIHIWLFHLVFSLNLNFC